MTRIDFHTRLAEPLNYACRLVRKAYGSGKQVAVVGDPATLARFDSLLWTFSPLDFIPHCAAGAPRAAETPVVLCASGADAPHHSVLLNLGDAVPPQFARFERLLEVVGDLPDQLACGRDRYRFYRDRGYAITNH